MRRSVTKAELATWPCVRHAQDFWSLVNRGPRDDGVYKGKGSPLDDSVVVLADLVCVCFLASSPALCLSGCSVVVAPGQHTAFVFSTLFTPVKSPADMILPSTILALFAASPLANAQRFRPTRTGCLLDQSAQIIADIKCGRKSAVAFAVEWYGADAQELQAWLGAAGCSEQEASDEAQWAVERCRVQPRAQARLGLDQEQRVLAWKDSGRRVAGKRYGQHDRRASIVAENESLAGRDSDEASSASTTISTSTTTLASTTSPTNTWTLVLTTNDATTTKTCATTSSFTTTVCSTNTIKHTSSCTTPPTETMACLPGFDCAFTDAGAFTCYEKTGVRAYGRLIAAVLGLAALFAAAAVLFRFCRHRKQQGEKARRLRGGDAAVFVGVRGEKESFGVGVAEVGASPPSTPARIADTVPLMEHGEFYEAAVPGDAYPGKRPLCVVQQYGG